MLTPSEYAAIGRRVEFDVPQTIGLYRRDRDALWALFERFLGSVWQNPDTGQWLLPDWMMGEGYETKEQARAALLESLGGEQ